MQGFDLFNRYVELVSLQNTGQECVRLTRKSLVRYRPPIQCCHGVMELGRGMEKAICTRGHRPSSGHLSDTCSFYAATETFRNMDYREQSYSWAKKEVTGQNLWKYRWHFRARLTV